MAEPSNDVIKMAAIFYLIKISTLPNSILNKVNI